MDVFFLDWENRKVSLSAEKVHNFTSQNPLFSNGKVQFYEGEILENNIFWVFFVCFFLDILV